jgi:predicted metal-dependent hydrolase
VRRDSRSRAIEALLGVPWGVRTELHEGAHLFNAGRYWEAHEAWETPWRATTGQERAYVQALILLAAALHKRWAHGSLTARNYHKARRYLAMLPDVHDGVDLARLAREVEDALNDPDARPRLPV